MIVVMENGMVAPRPGVLPPPILLSAGRCDGTRPSENVVVNDLIPMIDATYRTVADRGHRAIAGLSMGAGQAMQIGLANLDRFSGIGSFSGGAVRKLRRQDIEQRRVRGCVIVQQESARILDRSRH